MLFFVSKIFVFIFPFTLFCFAIFIIGLEWNLDLDWKLNFVCCVFCAFLQRKRNSTSSQQICSSFKKGKRIKNQEKDIKMSADKISLPENVTATDKSEKQEDEEKVHIRLSEYLTKSPAYLSSMMRRHVLKQMVRGLPEEMQSRVKSLKNVQLDCLKLEAKFYEEVYQLERKYQDLYQPLYDKRKTIVSGEYEPTVDECSWESDPEQDPDDAELITKLKNSVLEDKVNYDKDVKGIPGFWFTIFRSIELLASMVTPEDEPILQKLIDIKIKYEQDPMSYTLEFHFEPNEFFTNKILTKQYFLKSTVDVDFPFAFEGPEIYKCTGCIINWNKNMNVTVRTIRKKQKHKQRGAVRTVTKQVPADSFFNFFNPPKVDDNKADLNTQSILGTDFEIGHFLRARVIPKAVLYFTGEIVDDDDELEEEEGEEEEDDDDEEEDDEDDEEPDGGDDGKPKKGGKMQRKKPENPAECQTQ